MQDYKSLCAAVTICSTLVNIQTHTNRQHLTSLFYKLSQLRWRYVLVDETTETSSREMCTCWGPKWHKCRPEQRWQGYCMAYTTVDKSQYQNVQRDAVDDWILANAAPSNCTYTHISRISFKLFSTLPHIFYVVLMWQQQNWNVGFCQMPKNRKAQFFVWSSFWFC